MIFQCIESDIRIVYHKLRFLFFRSASYIPSNDQTGQISKLKSAIKLKEKNQKKIKKKQNIQKNLMPITIDVEFMNAVFYLLS